MAQTDRQTDKGTWWSVTAFNEEIQRLESPESYPDFVKKVYGGREECPDTKRLHFQGAVQCHRQVRLSQFKQWLPTAHFEIARSSEALKKYAMKTDTAAGEKLERVAAREYWPMERALCEIGALTVNYDEREFDIKARYWMAVKQICRKQPFRISQFSNPALEKAWIHTHQVWEDELTRALVLQPEAGVEVRLDGQEETPV